MCSVIKHLSKSLLAMNGAEALFAYLLLPCMLIASQY